MKKKQPGSNVVAMSSQERTYELRVERFLNKDFSDSLSKLIKLPMRPNEAMKVKRASLLIGQAVQTYLKARTETFEKYCLRDDQNELVFEDEGKTRYKVPEDKQQDCLAELESVVSATVAVPVVRVSAFQGVDLTPEFLGHLDGLVVEG